MAVHALDHAGRDLFGEDVSSLDRPVTGSALLAGFRVAGVAKEHEVGNLVDADPVQPLVLFAYGSQLLDLRAVFLDRAVAEQTLLGSRQSGPFLPRGACVAIEAFDAGRGMGLMAEPDGLRGNWKRQVFNLALIAGLRIEPAEGRRQQQHNHTQQAEWLIS